MPIPSDIMNTKLLEWAHGDTDAAAFLLEMTKIVRLADDLADGDSLFPTERMGELLQRTIVFVPSNPFFQKHIAVLTAVWSVIVNSWVLSERWRFDPNEKTRIFAFVRREDVEQLLFVVATITGGIEHARRVMQDIHAVSHADGETFAEWDATNGHVRG